MSHHTIQSYKTTFVLLIAFMEQHGNINVDRLSLKDITRDRVVQFLDWVEADRQCCKSTRNVRLAAVHSFVRYLQYSMPDNLSEWQRILAISVKKASKQSINYITVEGMKLLLDQPDLSTHKGRRDLAMLALMYDCAARVQEIIDLTPAMIRLNKPYTVKIIGKGNKARIVPLMEQEVMHLKRYLQEHKLLESHANLYPLFSNKRREKLTRAGVAHILSTYLAKARNIHPNLIPEKASCHSLRHSKAMHLLQAGVNLIYIRDILGHTSVQTTEIYARVDSKQKREAIEKAFVGVVTKETPVWSENDGLLSWLKAFK